ncbi:MAG: putative PEP-binding protein [Cyanobacteria bacterium J06638_20]
MEETVQDLDTLCWLDQVRPADRIAIGDKAYYLGLIQQRGYPVVPGFVVTASVFRHYLDTLDWLEPLFADLPDSTLHLNVDRPQQLQTIARQIRQSIFAAPLDEAWQDRLAQAVQDWQAPAVILRPSLALEPGVDPAISHRIRGLLPSQTCWADGAAIAQGIQTMWAELFRARSLFYWQRSGIELRQVRLGVLVQPLWAVQAAGDAEVSESTVHVRAVRGYGHGLVQGDMVADHYYLATNLTDPTDLTDSGELATDREAQADLQVESKSYAYHLQVPQDGASPLAVEMLPDDQQEHPALTADQRDRLQKLAQQLRTSLGNDVELEWCCYPPNTAAGGDIYITQVTLSFPANTSIPEIPSTSPPEPPVITPVDKHWTVLRGWAASPGRSLGRVECLSEWSSDLEQQDPPPNTILVAPQITPEWLPLLRKVAGLVTAQGSFTSHGAILARELGIPAVVGISEVMQRVQTGDQICVDGDRGILMPLSAMIAASPSSEASPTPTAPSTVHATQLLVTLSQPERLTTAANLPVDGLGLLRSELLMMGMLDGHRSVEARLLDTESSFVDALANQIQRFADAFAPRPVFYRSADLRSHEYRITSTETTQNPLLGSHGTLAYSQDPTLFLAELEALRIAQRAGATHLRLILPFVRTVEEVRQCYDWIQQAGLLEVDSFQVWIMAEVPAVLFQLAEMMEAGVQGISIGTNDFTQLLLAIDRDHPKWAKAYPSNHPAVLRALHQLIQTAKSLKLPCIVCGEAPTQYSDLIPHLVQWGITGISAPPNAIAEVKQAIARAEHQLLLDAARQLLG